MKMSIKLICKPEFFSSRLSSPLGLSGGVEPGTTYFLCTDLTEVPTLVSSQDPLSLTAMSGEGKVQILICKDKPCETKTSYQSKLLETCNTTRVPTGSNLTKVKSSTNNEMKTVDCIKQENICSVTSSSDNIAVKEEDKKPVTTGLTSVEPHVIRLFRSNSVPSGMPIPSSTCAREFSVSVPSFNQSAPGTSLQTSGSFSSNLPCQALRHGLKQAILQRRRDQGKTAIDLVKEETERQIALQTVQISDEEMERQLKRRESNNKAARKCREKKRVHQQLLGKEVKRLRAHKNKLNDLVSTLEGQQSFLRMWSSGAIKIDDQSSQEMIKSIMDSEIVIPTYPHRMEYLEEDDDANSFGISSSEYNSDDTRNEFDLESSQDTNDSTKDSTAVGYTEMTVKEINSLVGQITSQEEKKEEGMFKEIKYECEDLKSDSDDDSDVELIEIDKPLVIDID